MNGLTSDSARVNSASKVIIAILSVSAVNGIVDEDLIACGCCTSSKDNELWIAVMISVFIEISVKFRYAYVMVCPSLPEGADPTTGAMKCCKFHSSFKLKKNSHKFQLKISALLIWKFSIELKHLCNK
jgi:hypothetical protein